MDRTLNGPEGIDRLANRSYDVVLVTAPVPDFAVADLLERLLSLRRSVPVVVFDPIAQVADAVRYMQLGAYEVAGPGDDPVAKMELAAEVCRRKSSVAASEPWREMLIGTSPAMQRTVE
ncbi:MAG TPA: hypothetical protein VLN48_17475, partial [Bryobacteraceae bacterium]|nr:hypothetical protein [Bryobacteraceae bacterium]